MKANPLSGPPIAKTPRSWFLPAQRVELLRACAASWIGTKFHPNGEVKSAGVSCQKFPGCLYKEVGFLPAGVGIPDGPIDWSRANTDSLIATHIDEAMQKYFAPVEIVPGSVPRPGDLVGFQGRGMGCVHHLGIVLGISFVHVVKHHGVIESMLQDATYVRSLRRVWRPIEYGS